MINLGEQPSATPTPTKKNQHPVRRAIGATAALVLASTVALVGSQGPQKDSAPRQSAEEGANEVLKGMQNQTEGSIVAVAQDILDIYASAPENGANKDGSVIAQVHGPGPATIYESLYTLEMYLNNPDEGAAPGNVLYMHISGDWVDKNTHESVSNTKFYDAALTRGGDGFVILINGTNAQYEQWTTDIDVTDFAPADNVLPSPSELTGVLDQLEAFTDAARHQGEIGFFDQPR